MYFNTFPLDFTSFSDPQQHMSKYTFCNTAAIFQLHWSRLGSEERGTYMVLISYFHLKPISICSPHSPLVLILRLFLEKKTMKEDVAALGSGFHSLEI